MAIPATGSTIRLYADVASYFGVTSTPVAMGTLGTYLGISSGTTIAMSTTFGGQGT